MMNIPSRLKSCIVLLMALSLMSCSAMKTALEKRNLATDTKMSESIFLDPVPNKEKTVYVQIHNTSSVQNVGLSSQIKSQLLNKGYQVVNDPSKAHFVLQANVLHIGRMNKKRADDLIAGGYGAAMSGGALGALAGSATHSDSAPVIAGLAGAAVGMIADSAIKDVNYSMITDVQISERAAKGERMVKQTRSKLQQGTSGYETVKSKSTTNWKRYRTRIVSNAEKVNLKFAQAKPVLMKQLAGSISGLF